MRQSVRLGALAPRQLVAAKRRKQAQRLRPRYHHRPYSTGQRPLQRPRSRLHYLHVCGPMRMTADDRMEASPSDVKNVAALLASHVGTAIVHVMDDI